MIRKMKSSESDVDSEHLTLGLRQPAAAFPEPACWPGMEGGEKESRSRHLFCFPSTPAAGCGAQSGSRLPQAKAKAKSKTPSLPPDRVAAAFELPASDEAVDKRAGGFVDTRTGAAEAEPAGEGADGVLAFHPDSSMF